MTLNYCTPREVQVTLAYIAIFNFIYPIRHYLYLQYIPCTTTQYTCTVTTVNYMSYSLDGVFGGLGTAGFGMELTDWVSLARVLDDSTELSEGSSSIASGVDSFLLTGTAVGAFDIVAPLLFNNDASIPYGKHKPLHNSNKNKLMRYHQGFWYDF